MAFGGTNPTGNFGAADTPAEGGAGPWPGFDPSAPPAVAAASSTGTAATAARGDHTHQGVTSFNGLFGAVTANTIASVAGVSSGATTLVGLASAGFTAGALAYVQSSDAHYVLVQGALGTSNNVVNAAGAAGFQWLRTKRTSLKWQAQTAWFVDPANSSGLASDDNDGHTATTPLLTYTEQSFRLWQAYLTSTTTTTAMSSVTGSTTDTTGTQVFYDLQGSGFFLINGSGLSGTALYSGSVTSYAAQAAAPSADDNELGDTAIPTSFTASGLLATGLIFKRTNSTALYWFAAKDLGSKTCRITDPVDVNCTTITTLNVADTYSVYTLTVLPEVKFTTNKPFRIRITECSFSETGLPPFGTYNLTRCYIPNAGNGPTYVGPYTFLNTAWDCGANATGPSFGGGGAGFPIVRGGMIRSTAAGGAVVALLNGPMNFGGAITLQGAWPQQVGNLVIIQGKLSVFDVAGNPAFQGDYWAATLFFKPVSLSLGNAAISGKGNTSYMLSAINWSKLAYLTTGVVPFVDASTSAGASWQIGASSGLVASLPVLNSTTFDNGIFASQ